MGAPTVTLLRSCLVLWVGLGLLGGCSDPDQPSTLPSDTPIATSSSASPTPSTPEEEVEAAVRAYYAELTRAAQANDTSVLRTMTTKPCPCYRAVRVIERNGNKGLTTPQAIFRVTSVRVHNLESRSALAEVETTDEAYQVFDKSDQVIGHVPAREHLVDLTLVQNEDDRWIIANEFDLRSNP